MTASVGPLHPMAAVAAEMLEYGVIFRCSNCHLYSTDISRLGCPKCGRKTIAASIDKRPRTSSVRTKTRTGEILCESCGWKQTLNGEA
ncbi:MAG: hypothetical protein WED05_10605 [Candidatus Atabeyarchaeum deiterrae]